ncbi:hypothetical protein HRbin33_02629 [bacterium HR33]|nr:hypothetical protein HRbin33_02629 [bacterium HR33]
MLVVRRCRRIALVWLWLPASLAAQAPGVGLNVYLDCQTRNCDFDHVRRETPFVNWTRERQTSEVHILATSEPTAGGGRAYTVLFIGQARFAGRGDTLRFTTSPTDTDAEVRDRLTRTIHLGIARFAAATDAAPFLRLAYDAPEEARRIVTSAAEDPWNFWTFEIDLEGSFNAQARDLSSALEASVGASRVTDALKVEFGVFGRYSRDRFELEDDEVVTNVRELYSADLLMVWSLGPHWSLGFSVDATRSTFSNYDLSVTGGPALEYNIYPYGESTYRQLAFRYQLEGARFDYQQVTVEGKLEETLPRHSFTVGASFQQPWGEIDAALRGIQYLHDPAVHRIDTFGRVELRLFRGLSFDVSAEFSRIKDQFFLPAQGLTPEEVLLRRRQRETDYSVDLSLGITIRFGSAFANVVNPRMSGGRGEFF